MADIIGTEDDDDLSGTEFADLIKGLAGDDTISGNDGDDVIHGGDGNDDLWGADGLDRLYGNSGDDYLRESAGGDELYGGAGIDTLSLSYLSFFGGGHSTVTFVFDPSHGPIATPDGNTAFNVERLDARGSNGSDLFKGWINDDRIGGWDGDDRIFGRDGDDFLFGENGNDGLYGGNGNDLLTGNSGDDTLYGGRGNDTLIGGYNFEVDPGDDVLEGGPGADIFVAGLGRTSLVFTHSSEGVYVDLELGLGFGGDAEGDAYDGHISGAVLGSDFNDMIVNGREIYGNAGDDRLVAGHRTILMAGGDGSDTFVFRYDMKTLFDTAHITDFDQAAAELIDVHGIDARGKAGDQAFVFIGSAAFTGGKSGELRYEIDSANHRTTIQMNVNHDPGADVTIILDQEIVLTAADFWL